MDDPNKTPKPKQTQKRPTPDDDEANESPSKKSRTSTTTSTRSVIRQTHDLVASGNYHNSDFLALSQPASLPEGIRTLLTGLRSAMEGESTLPRSLEAKLEEKAEQSFKNIRQSEYYNGHTAAPGDGDPTWREIDMIVTEAKRCRLRNDIEAGWNSQVHGPLLTLATTLSRYSAAVHSVNLTHSRLLARLQDASSTSRSSKMVDFGLCLDDDNIPALDSAYRNHLVKGEEEVKTWNHTSATQISTKPLAVSVETKREGDSSAKAELQLATWVIAHFRRLLEIRKARIPEKGADRVIFLPLLKVLGSTWSFALGQCRYGLDDNKGNTRDVTIFWKYDLGDVSDHFGCFRVLRALLLLISWIHDHYLPWLEEWVTGGT